MIRIPAVVAPFVVSLATAQGPLPPAVGDVEVSWDVQYAEDAGGDPKRNQLDLFVPTHTPLPPIVMFVHGGAWTVGSKDRCEGLARMMAARGVAFASINTRQHPFAKPDAMVEDCGKALAWLHAHAGEHGCDGDRLFVMGHSSGAHLVAWLGLDATKLAEAGVPREALRGVIALSGVYETRPRHAALDKVFGTDTAVRAMASPLVHAGAGDPPCFLAWGEHDLPALSLCARMLRDGLTDAGVPVVCRELCGKGHVDYVFELGAAGNPLLDDILAFVADPPEAAPVLAAARARTTLAWVVTDTAGRESAQSLAKALEPHAIAVVTIDATTPEGVVAAWRRLGPAAAYIGGSGLGGYLAAAARLGTADGLRGRVLAGAPLGERSLAGAAPGVMPVDFAHLGGRAAPALLMLQAEDDPAAQLDDAAQVCNVLLQQRAVVHPVELAGTTTQQALAGAGRPADLVVPLLRAFLRP